MAANLGIDGVASAAGDLEAALQPSPREVMEEQLKTVAYELVQAVDALQAAGVTAARAVATTSHNDVGDDVNAALTPKNAADQGINALSPDQWQQLCGRLSVAIDIGFITDAQQLAAEWSGILPTWSARIASAADEFDLDELAVILRQMEEQ